MKHESVTDLVTQDETAANGEKNPERFVRLLGRYQQRVYSFILTLVPHWADADEVLQETNIVLWRNFSEFKPDTDFVRWANQVAYFEVLKFRRRQQKDHLFFSDAFVEEVAAEVMEMSETLQLQRDRLAGCLQKLSDRDRTLIHLRYDEGSSVKRVAEQLGRSADSVYKSLGRVRRMLIDCIHREKMAEERV
jgi:RNA polymerase sigma-70 factor (ECF subfamily)